MPTTYREHFTACLQDIDESDIVHNESLLVLVASLSSMLEDAKDLSLLDKAIGIPIHFNDGPDALPIPSDVSRPNVKAIGADPALNATAAVVDMLCKYAAALEDVLAPFLSTGMLASEELRNDARHLAASKDLEVAEFAQKILKLPTYFDGWELLPEDLRTHLDAFRRACELAKKISTGDDATYWGHELEVIERILRDLKIAGKDG